MKIFCCLLAAAIAAGHPAERGGLVADARAKENLTVVLVGEPGTEAALKAEAEALCREVGHAVRYFEVAPGATDGVAAIRSAAAKLRRDYGYPAKVYAHGAACVPAARAFLEDRENLCQIHFENAPYGWNDWRCVGRGVITNHAPKAFSRHVETPVRVVTNAAGRIYADFGRDAFGWLECEAPAGVSGTCDLVLGEMAGTNAVVGNPPGAVRCNRARFSFDGKGGTVRSALSFSGWGHSVRLSGLETIDPVVPFRYAELDRLPFPLAGGELKRVSIEYPFDRDESSFECDCAALNDVWELCKHTVIATSFAGLYLDGERERQPYEADAYINQLSGYAVSADGAVAQATHDFLMEHPTWPTEWRQCAVKMAWADWMQSGRTNRLARHYATLRDDRLMSRFARTSDGLLVTGGERGRGALPGAADIVDWPVEYRDGFVFRPVNAVVNAYYHRNLLEMRDMASALGRRSEASRFGKEAELVRKAFNRVFFDVERGIYRDGEGTEHATLHANAFALAFGLVPSERRKGVADYLVSRGMACGVYAAQFLLEALFVAGREDAAIALMTAENDTSWRGMMAQGATMTMEAWNWKCKSNLDWNHAWATAPANVIMRFVVGVTPVEPGCSRVRISPQPGSLKHVKARTPSVLGGIETDLAFDGDSVSGRITLPPNMTGEFVWRGVRRNLRSGVNDLSRGIGPQWIAVSGPTNALCETAAFVRNFAVEKSVTRAVWKTSGLGVYRLFVNGREVGAEDLLKPGNTDAYRCRHVYTYDVTDALVRTNGARNVLAALVSAGWWRDRSVNREDMASLRSAFWGELTVTLSDGSEKRILTDSSWRAAYAGPVRRATIYDGEDYDARADVGWMRTGGVDWPPAEPYDGFKGEMRAAFGAVVRLRRDLALGPKSGESFALSAGERRILDFGQNAAAVPEFVFAAPRGTVLDVDFAEMLNDSGEKSRGNDGPKGTLYRANYRTAKSHVRYVFAGTGDEAYRPTFTYFGYRYGEVRANGPVTVKSVRSIPVSSLTAEAERGTFETDSPLLNRLVENIRWGARSNFVSVPTDCPQRDERAGWAADTQVFAPAALYLGDLNDFYRKWMADMRDSQRPDGSFCQVAPFRRPWSDGSAAGWSDAGVIVPYVTWRMTGDRRIVDENWTAMCWYMACLRAHRGPWRRWWGDHLSYARNDDALREFLQYAYWAYDAILMTRMARATGRTLGDADVVEHFEKDLAEACKLMSGCDAPCQTERAYRLFLGQVWGDEAIKTADALCADIRAHGGRLQTGFLGTAILLDALVGAGRIETAYDVLLNRGEPGWLFTIDQGATTMWERWNSYTIEKGFGDAEMNSFNHYAYGAVLGWMYRSMAGIGLAEVPTESGSFVLAPKPDPRRRVGRVSAAWRSAWGKVSSRWEYAADGTWVWSYEIPAGASAHVILPDGRSFLRLAGTYREVVKDQVKNRD